MAWIDGLDIPLQSWLESTFFEVGPETVETDVLADRSRRSGCGGIRGCVR